VIAVHTFSLVFLRRQWSNRTCYIVLVVSWALLLLELCIETFIIAEPKKIGPYFGVAGYWCWITPAYPISRYATSYLLMFVSAGLSFILYLLVFFRLRGNITVSPGHKIYFHRRPQIKVGRANDGTCIVTDDQRVESHSTRVAKHMLWYPLAYTVIILPIASARFSTFNGASVPFLVTICTAALFMLHGFINTVLFCTTRDILPGSWRQRLGIGMTWNSGRSDSDLSSETNGAWRFTGFDARTRTVGAGTIPVFLSEDLEKDVEVMYDEAQSGPRYSRISSPSSPFTSNPPLRVHDGSEQRADTYDPHIRQLSFPNSRMSIRIENDGVETTLS
jgi:hypothetical protein